MKDLSRDARALLDALAAEHVAPPRLGTTVPALATRTRPEVALHRRRVAMVTSGVGLAAAAIVFVGVRMAPQPAIESSATPGVQAPYDGDSWEESSPVQESTSRASSPSRAISPEPSPTVSDLDARPPAAPRARVRGRRAAPPVQAPPEPTEPPVSSEMSSAATLAEEVRLLDRARSALDRDDLAAARAALRQHARRFPEGALAVERATLRKQARLHEPTDQQSDIGHKEP